MDDLYNLIPLLILLLLVTGVGLWLKRRYPDGAWVQRLKNPPGIYRLLIGWTIFGFIATLDYTRSWGCIISHDPIFSAPNLFFSGMSISLISLGYFSPSRFFRVFFLMVELVLWLFKLFAIKGGYAVGLFGSPSDDVVAFDFIALILRLMLIKQLFRFPFSSIYLVVTAFFILTTKIVFFRAYRDFFNETYEYSEELAEVHNKMIGEWVGTIELLEDKNNVVYSDLDSFLDQPEPIFYTDTVRFIINNREIKIYGIKEFQNIIYTLDFMFITDGDLLLLHSENDSTDIATVQNAALEIKHLTDDTLICLLNNKHALTLTRK